MTIKNAILAGVAGTLLAGGAMAGEPVKLTDAQLDGVAAGVDIVAGIAFVGPFTSIGAQSLTFTEVSQTATSQSSTLTPTSLTATANTQAAAGLSAQVLTSNPAGAAFQSGGSFAASGTISF